MKWNVMHFIVKDILLQMKIKKIPESDDVDLDFYEDFYKRSKYKINYCLKIIFNCINLSLKI